MLRNYPQGQVNNTYISGQVTDKNYYNVELQLNNSGDFVLLNYSTEKPANSSNMPVEYSDNLLKISSVKTGSNDFLYNAILTPNNSWTFSVLHYLDQPTVNCTEKTLSLDKFKQIKSHMDFDQVSNILGCSYELTLYEPGLESGSTDSYYFWQYHKGKTITKIIMIFTNQNLSFWGFFPSIGNYIGCYAPPLVAQKTCEITPHQNILR